MTITIESTTCLAAMPQIPVAVRLTISGCVQGVGLRPAIARLAVSLELAGEVHNAPAGVVVVLEGPKSAVESFPMKLRDHFPPEARIRSIQCHSIEVRERTGFEILLGSGDGSVLTQVPCDLVVCTDCLKELSEKADRRHGYPFISCTDCGPRYSIIHSLPFERAATTMNGFNLCAACRADYTDMDDRRYHAQAISCAECGPHCWLVDAAGRMQAQGADAVGLAAKALRTGQIVALKGLGGYQLLTDATNPDAVSRLRQRKGRPCKPLAVMVTSLAIADSLAQLDEEARATLTSSVGPIVIAPARCGTGLADDVHCGLDGVGLMLPTTPLHVLLARECPPLVATSGNRDGEPLAWENADAQRRLADIADVFLHHDRPIRRAIDDSVVRIIAGRSVTIRAARGLAPLPLEFAIGRQASPQILAVGGQQKVALALHNGCQAVLGPHLGDLDELFTRERFTAHVEDMQKLYLARPQLVVHDAHPDYFTSAWAAAQGLPTLAVQHHHAHVVAGMIEQGWLDREVLGVAWDGTGYGPDGTIWGGEFLRATATGYRRVARLRPISLIGGAAAVREPFRVALAVLRDSLGAAEALRFLIERGYSTKKLNRVMSVPQRAPFALLSSSAGRLFDAVAAILLPQEVTGGGRSQYEGHAAILLEAACGNALEPTNECKLPAAYQIPMAAGDPAELDWRPLVAALVTDVRRGLATGLLATRFHVALAGAIVQVALRHAPLPVVLGGGVFQNRLLTELIATQMADKDIPLGLPGVIPPNDGGLAAGQLAIAISRQLVPTLINSAGGTHSYLTQ